MTKYYLILLVLGLAACGGGTTGTSATSDLVSKTYQGKLIDENGEPIADATVLSPFGPESVKTDDQGNYVINTVTLEGGEALVVLSQDGQTIRTFEPAGGPGTFDFTRFTSLTLQDKGLRIEAVFTGGECVGRYAGTMVGDIENQSPVDDLLYQGRYLRDVLARAGYVSEGAFCELSITVTKDGQPVPGVEFELREGGCDDQRFEGKYGLSAVEAYDLSLQGELDVNGSSVIPFRYSARPGKCEKIIHFAEIPGYPFPASVFVLDPNYL